MWTIDFHILANHFADFIVQVLRSLDAECKGKIILFFLSSFRLFEAHIEWSFWSFISQRYLDHIHALSLSMRNNSNEPPLLSKYLRFVIFPFYDIDAWRWKTSLSSELICLFVMFHQPDVPYFFFFFCFNSRYVKCM